MDELVSLSWSSQYTSFLYTSTQSYGEGVVDLHAQSAEVLLVGVLGHLGDNLPLVDVLLQRRQDLQRVDGLDEIVGYLRTDGLLHDVLLFTFRHHHDRCGGRHFLDTGQCLQSAHARHILIQKYEVEVLLVTEIQGIVAIADRHHLIALLLEKKSMCLE